jgi:predicted dehydrogenase
MLLPHLANDQGLELAQVATRRSLSAVNAQRKFGFEAVSTDPEAVFADDSIDAVFIVTRHSTHANLVCRALEAGKAVFVEKPLALTIDELDRILETVQTTGNDRVMVGFNRRFAPILVEMRSRFGPTSEPTNARYLVNAGRLGSDSWYRDEREGSRFVGEGGHFVDTMSWWIGSDPTEVVTLPGANPDEVQMSLRYEDGSLGTITYATNANRRFPKEMFDVSSGGKTARLDNFRRATVWTGSFPRTRRRVGAPDKGQSGEIDAFLESLRTGGAMPISLDSLTATTRATLVAVGGETSRAPQQL